MLTYPTLLRRWINEKLLRLLPKIVTFSLIPNVGIFGYKSALPTHRQVQGTSPTPTIIFILLQENSTKILT